MEIKLTLRQADVALDGINVLAKEKLPVLVAYEVSKLQRKLSTELELFSEMRDKVLIEHGKKGKNGSYTVPAAKLEKFNSDITKLLNKEVVIDRVKSISIDELSEAAENIPPEVLTKIAPLLDEDEDKSPVKPEKAASPVTPIKRNRKKK